MTDPRNTSNTRIETIEAEASAALSLPEICEVLELRSEVVCEWVEEGVVHPAGEHLTEWRFTGRELERARRARRLQRDLELETRTLPLVLDLLGELERLRARLRVVEERYLE